MVELVLCLPLLVLFLCGIIEFGFVIYQVGRVYEAARQAGRYAAMGVWSSRVEAAVQSLLPEFVLPQSVITIKGFDEANVEIVRSNIADGGAAAEDASGFAGAASFPSGTRVEVTVDFAIRTLTPLPVYLIANADGNTRRVRGQATFQAEVSQTSDY